MRISELQPGELEGHSGAADRRKQARLPLNIPVMLSIYQWLQEGSFSGQSAEGVLRDVSEEGLQIASTLPLAVDMFVIIHLPPDSGLPPMTGRIIRIDKEDDMFHYGCLLSGLPLFQRLQLKEYLDKHLSE
nr:PilZ domain-containing protein [Cohnella pontilimi]